MQVQRMQHALLCLQLQLNHPTKLQLLQVAWQPTNWRPYMHSKAY
jgi:hypothetical protein